ncbi:hypothetical protein [Xanthomonas arboricola]|uniref:hypothetical protein n=1 Tax=Xanthomonas arboricola TaxID=56448 RepID=UPI00141A785C|nr:hypothetical protein [Xanthomonas arboricola]NIK51491.1 hypothetical protein [Xanthomonas arboricola]
MPARVLAHVAWLQLPLRAIPHRIKLPTVQRLNATMDHLQVITQFSFKALHGVAMVRGCMPARGDGIPLSFLEFFRDGI